MDEATKQALFTLVRNILVAAGGIVTAKGWISASDWALYSGAALLIGSGALSVWQSFHKSRKADEREAVALNAGITKANLSSADVVPLVPKEEVKAVIASVTTTTTPA